MTHQQRDKLLVICLVLGHQFSPEILGYFLVTCIPINVFLPTPYCAFYLSLEIEFQSNDLCKTSRSIVSNFSRSNPDKTFYLNSSSDSNCSLLVVYKHIHTHAIRLLLLLLIFQTVMTTTTILVGMAVIQNLSLIIF